MSAGFFTKRNITPSLQQTYMHMLTAHRLTDTQNLAKYTLESFSEFSLDTEKKVQIP